VPGATVTLFQETSPGSNEFTEIRSTTTGPQGSFAFTGLETELDYRVDAEITIDGEEFSGFNEGQLENLSPGTTTAGITLTQLVLDDQPTNPTNYPDAYTDGTGVVNDQGLNPAVSDYLNGDLSDSQINAIIESYLIEEPIET
jgi:hypothetical protein